MLSAPVDHPLNLTTQTVLTVASYLIWAALLVISVRMGMRQKTPFFVIIVFAAAFGALFEPLYDVGFMLWFYSPGMWSSFTSYGIPQPIWAYSGYVALYAGPAIFICNRIENGMTRKDLFRWAAIVFLCSCAFEMYGIFGGAYSYWGPHVFRVFDYPLIIGVLETAQVICFSVAATELRRRTTGTAPLLSLFVLFPCMFYFGNFGAGAPVIIALHTPDPSPALVMAGTLISTLFALTLIWGASRLLPAAAPARVVLARA
jgi:hypothetical protein